MTQITKRFAKYGIISFSRELQIMFTSLLPPLYLLYMTAPIIAIWVILYAFRFKYPLSIRRLRDFKRALKFGRDPGKIVLKAVRSRQSLLEATFNSLIAGKPRYSYYGYNTTSWKREGNLELVDKLLKNLHIDEKK
jgi:hypothetical protein